MQKRVVYLLLFLSCAKAPKRQTIQWNEWNPNLFDRARKENKLVLLDVKANWCHWCHVMEDSTYTDPNVIAYINENFIAVEADHDARPDLAARYRKWGWPATVIFTSDGKEILKNAGFVNPGDFLQLLKSCVKNPSAEKNLTNATVNKKVSADYFSKTALPQLEKRSHGILDMESGGFDRPMKYIDWSSFEYILHAYKSDTTWSAWLKNSVYNAQGLMDKEWGGVYQYSTYGDWNHPHYEKLLRIQSRYINVYTWYAQQFKDTSMLRAAEKITDYCFRFLWNEGKGFYNSQNADLKPGQKSTWYFNLSNDERMKHGIPSIDKHIYTSTNAQMAKSLIILWGATGKEKYLNTAQQMIEFLLTNRKTPEGGFIHDDTMKDVMVLADNLPMADALLMLYRATGNKKYLNESIATSECIQKTFRTGEGNYRSDVVNNGLPPNILLNENIEVCRFFNLLSYAGGRPEFKVHAQQIFKWLSSPAVINSAGAEPGIIMAYNELRTEPLTGTFLVINSTNESNEMIQSMVAYPGSYFANHTFQKNTIPSDKKDLLGSFNSNILFFCTSTYCSSPVYTANEMEDFFSRQN